MFRLRIIACLALSALLFAGCGSKSKDELYAEGVSLLKGGNPGGAIVLFRNALEKDQNFQDARFQLAEAYQALGKYEQAEKELLKIQRQNPSRADIHLELAKLYNSLGKPDQSIEQSSAYLQARPNAAEAFEVLGVSYALKGMNDEAERQFRLALQREPNRLTAKLQLAALLMGQKQGREQDARALIAEILSADPKNVKAYNLLARYEMSLGNRDRALQIYQTVAGLQPADPLPLYQQGAILLEKADVGKADQLAEMLVRKFPKSSEGYRLKGLIAFKKQNYPEAITDLQNANKIYPSVEGLYYLGLSLYEKGELESALSQFRQILDHKPSFAQARILTAVILLKQKRLEDAIAEAQRVLDKDNRNALAHNILGSAYMARGNYDEGIKELNRATELDPKIVDAHLKKGLFYLSKGLTQEAESDFTTAVKVAPDLLNSRLVLAFYYLRQEKRDKALTTLKAGLTGQKSDAVLYNTMSAVLFDQKNPAEGVRALQKAQQIDPSFLPARFNLATYYATTGDLAHATDEYRTIIRDNPRNVRALLGMAALAELTGHEREVYGWYVKAKETGAYPGYLALAAYLEKQGRHGEAIGILDEAIRSRPRSPEAYVAKGQLLLAQRKLKDTLDTYTDLESFAPQQGLSLKVTALLQANELARALEEARRAVALQPNSAFGYTLTAAVYARQRDYSRAIQELKSGLGSDPDNIEAAMQLGDYLGRSGNTRAALDEYDKILRGKPEYAPAIFAQGMLLETTGNRKGAIHKYRQALEKSENYVPALNNLAFLYADGFGPRHEALRLALTALRLQPGNAAIIDTYGYALLMNGRKAEARKVLEKAAVLLPGNPSVRYHLALAYQLTGDRTKAAATLQQAMRQGDFPESGQARKLLAELSAHADRDERRGN